jgi:hypothetical protein
VVLGVGRPQQAAVGKDGADRLALAGEEVPIDGNQT